MFNWGEPLLHKQTPEFIQYAKSKDITVILSTNLSMNLSDEYIQSLVKSGLDVLVVSLDGATAETYVKYRRGGNFSLVRENMLRIHSAKERLGVYTPTVVWQFLVFRHNQHEVEIAKRNYKTWGADSLSVQGAFAATSRYGKGYDEGLIEPSTIPQYNLGLPENPAQEAKRKYTKNRPCPWLYEAFVLNANGKVSPCCAVWDEKNDFAEYSASSGFFDTWNSERFQRARRLFSRSQKFWDSVATSSLQTLAETGNVAVHHSEASVNEKQLICHKCPMYNVPFCLDIPENSLNAYAYRKTHLFLRTRNTRHLIGLLLIILMGGPPVWQFVGSALKMRILRSFGNFDNDRID